MRSVAVRRGAAREHFEPRLDRGRVLRAPPAEPAAPRLGLAVGAGGRVSASASASAAPRGARRLGEWRWRRAARRFSRDLGRRPRRGQLALVLGLGAAAFGDWSAWRRFGVAARSVLGDRAAAAARRVGGGGALAPRRASTRLWRRRRRCGRPWPRCGRASRSIRPPARRPGRPRPRRPRRARPRRSRLGREPRAGFESARQAGGALRRLRARPRRPSRACELEQRAARRPRSAPPSRPPGRLARAASAAPSARLGHAGGVGLRAVLASSPSERRGGCAGPAAGGRGRRRVGGGDEAVPAPQVAVAARPGAGRAAACGCERGALVGATMPIMGQAARAARRAP